MGRQSPRLIHDYSASSAGLSRQVRKFKCAGWKEKALLIRSSDRIMQLLTWLTISLING